MATLILVPKTKQLFRAAGCSGEEQTRLNTKKLPDIPLSPKGVKLSYTKKAEFSHTATGQCDTEVAGALCIGRFNKPAG